MNIHRFLMSSFVAALLLNNLANCARDNKQKKEGIMITLPSGLRYEVLHHGSEKTPKAGQTANVHYTGWLSDNGKPGKEFDSSARTGKPFSFPVGVGRVIKGWDEAVLSMGIGEKRRLIIPPDLAYGAKGHPPVIPENATLIFEVELLSID